MNELRITADDFYENEAEHELRIVEGEFLEGEMVTVEVIKTGRRYTRRVKYSARKYGDLYITINNMDYPLVTVE